MRGLSLESLQNGNDDTIVRVEITTNTSADGKEMFALNDYFYEMIGAFCILLLSAKPQWRSSTAFPPPGSIPNSLAEVPR